MSRSKRSATGSVRPARPGRGAAPAPAPPPALSVGHPAFLFAALVAAGVVAASVTYLMFDTDVWQHLTVGRAIWSLHRVPTTELWTWPTYGAPDVNSSWGFRALIWPVWKAWGVWGLYGWRWGSTLVAFGLLVAAGRRMGARGLTALGVAVACALVYRQRSQVRPETLVAVLLGLELWVLEGWRSGGKDRTGWLVGIAWVWANAHISYWVGLGVMGIYAVDAMVGRRRWGKLVWVGLASGAISFVNPWGWRALWQPIEYFLYWRKEAIMTTIGELRPVLWSFNLRNTLPVLVVAWPVLLVWRWRRRGVDVAEVLMLVMFSAMAFPSQRFLGYWALVAVPYLARDLGEWVAGLRLPAMLRFPWVRAVPLAVACVAFCLPEWRRPDMPLGVGFEWKNSPVRACDFMEAHGVRGRGFNKFAVGGYMLYRFWPQADRLPFMDIHQAGTREDRDLYTFALGNPVYWRRLDAKYHFDYALLPRVEYAGENLLDALDADPLWAKVFMDDAAVLLVRRRGPLDSLARVWAYDVVPAGRVGIDRIGAACTADTVVRARARMEWEREAASSPWNSRAKTLLARVALLDGRRRDAERLLTEALAVEPTLPGPRRLLGVLALERGDPRAALGQFKAERALFGESSDLDLCEGEAWLDLGDPRRALNRYAAAVRRDPRNAAARDSFAALRSRLAR